MPDGQAGGTRPRERGWLPFLDTSRTLCLSPEPALERMLFPTRAVTSAT